MKKPEKAYNYIAPRAIWIPKWKTKDWLATATEITAEQLLEIARRTKQKEFAELRIQEPVLVECTAEERTIQTKYGDFPVLDVKDVKTGKEWTIIMKHKLLLEKMLEFKPLTGKRVYIMNLGKVPKKNYYDYIVMLENDVKRYLAEKTKTKKEK